jgi:single-strand DNA-binding protein
MKKGSAILVSGRLQQRQWEQEGQKRSKVEIVVEDFNFVGGNDSGSGGGGSYQNNSSSDSSNSSAPPAKSDDKKEKDAPKSDDLGNEPINLDDIPF